MKTDELISAIRYEMRPGIHTYAEAECCNAHWSRGGGRCGHCLDGDLLKRGIDLAKTDPEYWKRREDGRLEKIK